MKKLIFALVLLLAVSCTKEKNDNDLETKLDNSLEYMGVEYPMGSAYYNSIYIEEYQLTFSSIILLTEGITYSEQNDQLEGEGCLFAFLFLTHSGSDFSGNYKLIPRSSDDWDPKIGDVLDMYSEIECIYPRDEMIDDCNEFEFNSGEALFVKEEGLYNIDFIGVNELGNTLKFNYKGDFVEVD